MHASAAATAVTGYLVLANTGGPGAAAGGGARDGGAGGASIAQGFAGALDAMGLSSSTAGGSTGGGGQQLQQRGGPGTQAPTGSAWAGKGHKLGSS